MRWRPRSRVARWLGVVVVCAIGIGYVQPVRAYLAAKTDVEHAQAQRAALLREQGELRTRLAFTETDTFLEREARKLGLVRPGEELFIVQLPDGS